jgi:16S rRNA (guanine527-N7)-methyltransferase
MTPAEGRILAAGAAELGVEIEPASIARLDRFLALLDIWNRRIRLTGERDRKLLIERHLLDCLALVPHLPEAGTVVDVGSGAGFPGIVLACLRPDLDLVLLESRRRPTSFLREAIRVSGLARARAVETRAEEAAHDLRLSGRAAVVTTRAVRLDIFLRLAGPLLAPSGQAIAMQSPRTTRTAAASAAAVGLRLTGRRDYRVAGSPPRTLLFFRPAASVP